MTPTQAYRKMIQAFESDNLKFRTNDEKMSVNIGFSTDDLDVDILFIIDSDRKLVRLFSTIPCKFPEDKRVEGAVAVAVANHGMVNGNFDYDMSDGEIVFKAVAPFENTDLDEEIYKYLLGITVSTVDKYNDRFFALCKGMMDLQTFMEKEQG